MSSRDFCFWLFGWFELNGLSDKGNLFNDSMFKTIQEKLKVVLKVKRRDMDDPSYKFCTVLDTLLEFNTYEEINERMTVKIREQLNSVIESYSNDTYNGYNTRETATRS